MQVPAYSDGGYRVRLRTTAPRPTLTVRAITYEGQAFETVSACVDEVDDYLRSRHILPTAAPFARFITYKSDFLELEAGYTLAEPVAVQVEKVAVTWHVGPYGTLVRAVDAGSAWSLQNGYGIAGPPWAYFWTDPREVADSAQWKTEVVWPLK